MSANRLLDEIALAGPEHLDPAYVASYDRKAQVDADTEVEDLRSRGLGPASTLIDFGAGTVTFVVAAAAACAREAEPRIAEWLDTATSDRPEDGWTREELEAHLREEHSTFSWLLEPLIEHAGFEITAASYGPAGSRGLRLREAW
jgi:hypothetical protein